MGGNFELLLLLEVTDGLAVGVGVGVQVRVIEGLGVVVRDLDVIAGVAVGFGGGVGAGVRVGLGDGLAGVMGGESVDDGSGRLKVSEVEEGAGRSETMGAVAVGSGVEAVSLSALDISVTISDSAEPLKSFATAGFSQANPA